MILARDRLIRKYGLNWQDSERFIALLHRRSELVAVTKTVHGCRDPKDDPVIETAFRGGAGLIVTSDQDLQDPSLAEYLALGGVRVLTAGQFLAELEARSSTD